MNKNKDKTIKLEYSINRKGNWNYKNPKLNPVFSKPIAIIHLDNDKFVFKHEEILKLVAIYHKVDLESIKLIENGESGEVKNFETLFIDKLQNFINDLRKIK